MYPSRCLVAPLLLLLFMLFIATAHGAVTVGVGGCYTREGLLGFTQRGVCVGTTRTYGPTYNRPIARRGMGVGIRTSVRLPLPSKPLRLPTLAKPLVYSSPAALTACWWADARSVTCAPSTTVRVVAASGTERLPAGPAS
jgi:hypothetical protein